MPVIDGKVVRARYTSLKLNELSAVDRPAQPGAKAVIMKRDDRLEEPANKRDENSMTKTVEQLEGEIAKLTGTNTSLTAQLATATKALEDMTGERDKAKEDCDKAQKALIAATDEVIKSGDVEVRKSEVGEASFTMLKAMRDERDMAQFEKRAETEFGHVVGTTTEKAAVLKAFAGMSEDTRKAAEAVFTAAEKMAAAGFERLGSGGVVQNETQKAATGTFMAKVAEIAKRDSIPQSAALAKARTEFPAEFAAYNGAAN